MPVNKNKMEGKVDTVEVNTAITSELLETNFQWELPNKFQINKIYSEKVTLGEDIECTLMILPKQDAGSIMNGRFVRAYFTVFFTKVPNDEHSETFFRYEVKTRRNGQVMSHQDFKKMVLTTEGYQADRNYLHSNNLRYFLDKNGTLDLDISILLKNLERYKSVTLSNFEKERTNLAKSYAEIYKDMKCSDIILICANNETVQAHKVFLAARSPVFAKVLTDEVTTYDIGDGICKEALKEFLRFLYCDTIDTVAFGTHSIEIWQLAIKFEVSELMKLAFQDIFHGSKIKMHCIHQKMSDLTMERAMQDKKYVEIVKHIKELHDLVRAI